MALPAPLTARRRSHIPSRYCLVLMALSLGHEAAAQEKDHVEIGLGAAALPRFEGSDEYRARLAPLVDVRKGRFFARTSDGIGLNLLETPRFTIGASVAWMPGYRGRDVPDGIGKLSAALGGRVFVSTRVGGAVATLSATQALTESERGLLVNARVAYPYQVTERLKVTPLISTNWANGKYMDSYFGVDAARAAGSGFPVYQPSAGFKDISLRVAVRYQLNKHWSVAGAVGVSRLLGKAADSPFVKRETQPSALVGLTYTF
ncbi:MltA-interacting MipA family protein [Pigmentiphaga sp. NML080357]|nr:MltA-interacting MipA family protein [Pigmentiphaga sp. NML080357]